MGSQGPGDIPKVVRRRRARVRRQEARKAAARPPQQPTSTARQGKAFGTRPARPLPKPAPAPRPAARPPTATQTARAQQTGYVSQGKAVAAQNYRAKSTTQRRQDLKKAWATPKAQRTPDQRAAISIHHQRAAGDVAARARSTRAQQAAYITQGLAVHNAATAQSAAASAAATAVRAAKKAEDKQGKVTVAGLSFKPSKLLKTALQNTRIPLAGGSVPYKVAKQVTATPPGLKEAPVETALKQTQRGAYAVKNVINEDIKRHGVKQFLVGAPHAAPKAETKAMRRKAKRGFQLKEKTSGADILKTAGVKSKGVRAAGGLAIDIAAEGATTPGFGVGSVGARTATKVARRAERTAVKAGAAKTAARAIGRQRAATRVVSPAEGEALARRRITGGAAGPLRKAEQKKVNRAGRRAATRQRHTAGRGIAVRYAGVEIPGTRRATAAVGRGARKVARRGPGKTDAERRIERGTEHAIRTARVEKQAGHAEANRRAAAASAQLHDDAEKSAVARALDTGNIASLTPSWRKALKQAKGDKRAAQKIMEKEHPDEVRLSRVAHRLRSTQTGVHVAERQANVAERTEPENFLTKADRKKLRTTIGKQQAETQRAVQSARSHEQRAATSATLRETESRLHVTGEAKAARERDIARAQRAVARTTSVLRAEQRKPVLQRRGVATLQARVDAAKRDLVNARRPAGTRVTPAVGPRQGQAAERYQQRAADVQYHEARHAAARNVPVRGRGRGVPLDETHKAYLERVLAHAKRHDLKQLAKRTRKLLAKAPKLEETARGYFPRVTEEQARKQLGIAPPKESAATIRTGTARQTATRAGGKARKDVRRLSIVQAERAAAGEAPLSENPALVVGGRVREAREAVAGSHFAQNLARQGRRVTHADQLKDNEELYFLGRKGGRDGKYGLHPDEKVRAGKTPRQYVAMPKGVVERATKANEAVPKFDNRGLRAFDRLTSGYKGIITRNPMFHMKNAIGDVHRLVFEVPARGKVRSGVGAAKTARAVHQVERFEAGGTAPSRKALGAKISLGGGEAVTAGELAARARRHGLLDAGRSVQEQLERELLSGQGAKEGNVLRGNARSLRGAAEATLNPKVLTQDTPNTIRLTAFVAGKRMGLSDGDAADLAHRFFVDYGKLTAGERQVGRRILPFYTWTRQSLPATLKNFAANPARYGNLEAVRNEWNQMITGLSEDELNAQMTKFGRRNLPFVIPIGHDSKGNPQFKAVSASWAVTLLNNLPTSTSLTDVVRGGGEGGQTVAGMLNPLIRTPLELTSLMGGRGGHRLATDQAIEDPRKPRVPAPAPEWVKYLPKSLRDELRVSTVEDPRTGKKVVGWRGKADYGYKQLPSAARKAIDAAYALEQGGVNKPYETRPGLTTILGGFGITADEVSREVTKANARFEKVKQLAQANKELEFLPAGVGKDNPTPEWRRLRAKVNALTKELSPAKKKNPSLLGDLAGPSQGSLLGDLAGPSGQKSLLGGR